MPHLHSLRAVDDREEEVLQGQAEVQEVPGRPKRLADAGCAERLDRVHYNVDKKIKKKVLKEARSR